MSVFRRFFGFYINASIHVALGVVSLSMVSVERLNISLNLDLLGFLFCSTIACYNFVKYGVEAEKYLIVARPAHKPIQVFSFLALGFAFFFFFKLESTLWWCIGFLTTISGLYAIPFLPRSKNLRSLGGLKIFLVALVWTGFTLVLPAIDNGLDTFQILFPEAVQRYLLVLVLILPFEIRDLKYDHKALKTLPQRFGVYGTKRIGYALITIYVVLEFFREELSTTSLAFLVLLAVVLVLAITNSQKEQAKYYASFWVEGIPILWAFSIAVLKWCFSSP